MNENKKTIFDEYFEKEKDYYIVKRYYRFRHYKNKDNCFNLDCKKISKEFINLDEYNFIFGNFIETGVLRIKYGYSIITLYNFETHNELIYWLNKQLHKAFNILNNLYNKLSEEEKLKIELYENN